jgi:hypothetical protein
LSLGQKEELDEEKMKRISGNKTLRILLIVFSLLLIFTGTAHIMRGSLGWRNYWGGLVFPPFAIFFGLLLIYITIFRWRKLKGKARDRKGRLRIIVQDDWRNRRRHLNP